MIVNENILFESLVKPRVPITSGACAVHGITNEFLIGKPRFSDIAQEFMTFISGAELIIHNAPFDIGFINHEFKLLDASFNTIVGICQVLDTLVLARQKHPAQKNNLDALARRYGADHRERTYHGALLDAEILADVYLAMTGGQVGLSLHDDADGEGGQQEVIQRLSANRAPLKVIKANEQEMSEHESRLTIIDKACGGSSVWRQLA